MSAAPLLQIGWRTPPHSVIRIVPFLLILVDVFVPEERAVHVVLQTGEHDYL
jgi:hypothetical protein